VRNPSSKPLAWSTDPHLDFLDGEDADAFHAALAETGSSGAAQSAARVP
jgi:hypothetical protein